jgi:hypothetical protein
MKRSHEEMAATTDQDVAGSETVTFKIQYAKSITEVTRSTSSTIGQLKAEIDKLYDVPAEVQKLMFKGMLKDDEATLEKVSNNTNSCVALREHRAAVAGYGCRDSWISLPSCAGWHQGWHKGDAHWFQVRYDGARISQD